MRLWSRRQTFGLITLAFATAPFRSAANLTATVTIFESSTPHNAFPDECAARLDRLFIAEDLDLSLQVTFNRDLTDDESQHVTWQLVTDSGTLAQGDFLGQPNPALVTITLSNIAAQDRDALVHVLYDDVDLIAPLLLRIISNAEYTSATAALMSYVRLATRPSSRLPLTADLLARFVGQPSTLAGTPTVSTTPLSICDPRLTHRAGANWGSDTVTDVPLVHYAADQPASSTIAEAVARALLAQNPTSGDQTYSGGLNLNRPLDAGLALHSVQFDGSVSATLNADQTATDIHVIGTVTDLYDFDAQATGAGATEAIQAAKVQIASIKHDIGKVFVVSLDLDATLDVLDLSRPG